MHEYSLVQSLLERINDEAKAHNAISVHSLKISVGELSGVDPELFETAYQIAREGTLCAQTKLEIKYKPAIWVCKGCKTELSNTEYLQCPKCGEAAFLKSGADIILERIELEVP
ncbi:MAG: hydrogenase maturation nickel metallochaperone HypA [Deltaproteobacteria bacterium]|nr:hydrogenase maturation nickel metallochaperone HypA [Deltaproteobacteria bacterium]